MAHYHSSSSEETKRFGAKLAQRILRTPRAARAAVVALSGDLGTGKTTFVQGFFRGLGIRKRPASPTFILMRRSRVPGGMRRGGARKFSYAYHIDAYRLKKAKELRGLGISNLFDDPENILLVEWADRIKRSIPRRTLWVKFTRGKTARERILAISRSA